VNCTRRVNFTHAARVKVYGRGMSRRARLRKRIRREDDLEALEQALAEARGEEKEAAEPAQTAVQDQPAEKVLALQKTAGNQAVGAMLQRWAGPAMAALAPRWPKEAELRIDDIVVEVLGWEDGASRDPALSPSSGKGRADFEGPGDITVLLKHNDAAAKFWLATTHGVTAKTAELVLPSKDGKGMVLILTDVTVSNPTMYGDGRNDPYTSITLNFKKRKLSHDAPSPPRR
jgi:hypothetical protein